MEFSKKYLHAAALVPIFDLEPILELVLRLVQNYSLWFNKQT